MTHFSQIRSKLEHEITKAHKYVFQFTIFFFAGLSRSYRVLATDYAAFTIEYTCEEDEYGDKGRNGENLFITAIVARGCNEKHRLCHSRRTCNAENACYLFHSRIANNL
jgi:hypothetical protein